MFDMFDIFEWNEIVAFTGPICQVTADSNLHFR